LSSHALHSAVSDEAEANAASNGGHSECEWEHVVLVSSSCFLRLLRSNENVFSVQVLLLRAIRGRALLRARGE
jgi:hypothetical protein